MLPQATSLMPLAGSSASAASVQAADAAQAAMNRADGRDPKALRDAALAFESLFTQMMLQSMRATEFGDDLLGSGGDMYRDLFDQQISDDMSKAGGLGLADLMIRQMTVGAGRTDAGGDAAGLTRGSLATATLTATPATASAQSTHGFDSPQSFVAAIRPAVEAAADDLGVPPRYLMAQAVLETGWGAHMPRGDDGASSFNLFGIKAHGSDDAVTATTREFRGGRWLSQTDAFRAYDTPDASVADYVNFIRSNPRYAFALDHGGDGAAYVEGLQAAGYATDPDYANKLKSLADSPMLKELMANPAMTAHAS